MDGISCDRCGDSLLVDSSVRYIVNVEVYAAYDPMEITPGDLDRDFDSEYRSLIARIEEASSEELAEQIYVRRSFDLCPPCQRSLLADPLGRGDRKKNDRGDADPGH